MADFSDLPISARAQVLRLFTSNNFCFATTTNARTPTFYFAVGGLNGLQNGTPNGRLRTQHPIGGPLIEITTAQKSHWFFTPPPPANPPAIDPRNAPYIALGNVQNQNQLNVVAQGQRLVPQTGDLHLEFSHAPRAGRFVTGRHNSGGTIDMTRIHSTTTIKKIVEYILEYQCRVEIDRAVQLNVAPPLRPAQAVNNTVATFIANL